MSSIARKISSRILSFTMRSGEKSGHLISRNVTISGRRTSVRLEPEIWEAIRDICRRERVTIHEICSSIAANRQQNTSLTATIRVFTMSYYRAAATEDGHRLAGHGNGIAHGIVATMRNLAEKSQS